MKPEHRKVDPRIRLWLGACMALGLAIALMTSCGPPPKPMSEIADRGARIYLKHCVACHAGDPRFPGSIGPELQGVPMVVISLKTREGTYPAGYRPKRATKNMPLIALREEEISALYAFLNHER